MKRNLLLLAFIATVVAVAALSPLLLKMVYANPPSAQPQQSAPANTAVVEITIDDAGNMSIGGVDLKSLNVMPLDPQVVGIAKMLQNLHLTVADQTVDLDVQDTPALKIDWTKDSRQTAAALAQRFGVQLNPDILERVESWISTSNIDVTARVANEASKPAVIELTTPVQVDIAPNGQLTIEKIPLNAQIDQSALNSLMLGGKQATACWNKGKLTAAVDGAALPTITLNPEGVQVLNNALNLNITSIKEPLLASRFGVDLSLPGGAHAADATCQ